MLDYFLRGKLESAAIGELGTDIYYALITLALVVGGVSIYRRLVELGADRGRARAVAAFCVLTSYPLGIVSSQAVKMFYLPRDQWSFARWLEELTTRGNHTYHAALLLPFVAWAVYIHRSGLGAWRVWDTIMLSLPLGHAIGRAGCLVAGCCYGAQVHWHLGPLSYDSNNPVPLYEIAGNLVIYALLLRLYRRTHFGPRAREYDGCLVAGYLLLYGAMRFGFEIIRIEPRVAFGLTQAQLMMLVFMITGAAIALRVSKRAQHSTAVSGARTDAA